MKILKKLREYIKKNSSKTQAIEFKETLKTKINYDAHLLELIENSLKGLQELNRSEVSMNIENTIDILLRSRELISLRCQKTHRTLNRVIDLIETKKYKKILKIKNGED